MRTTLLFITLGILTGCPDVTSHQEANTSSTPQPVTKRATAINQASTSALVSYYLHFYDDGSNNPDYDTHNQVTAELIGRGAESIDEILQYEYCLDQYPYSLLTRDLIMEIGPDATSAIPRLAKRLYVGKDPTGQFGIVDCLVAIGPASIPELIQYYNGDDLHAVWAVSIPLRQLGPGVVPHLKPSLSSDNEERRSITMDTLSDIGPGAAELIPDVRRLLKSDTYRNRLRAARTLVNLGDTEAGLAFLLSEVDHWNGRVTAEEDPPSQSFWAIVEVRRCRISDTDVLIDKLLQTIEHPNTQRQRMAIDSLKPHGRDSRVQTALREIFQRADRQGCRLLIAGLFGYWGDEFPLDQETLVISLLEREAAATSGDHAHSIHSDLARIQSRRLTDSALRVRGLLEWFGY